MRAHFRHLRFKSFPPGVHRDSLSQNGSCLGSVSVHSLTLPCTLGSMYVMWLPGFLLVRTLVLPLPWLPGFLLLGLQSFKAFALTPGLPSSWPATLQPLCLGRESKASIATVYVFCFVNQRHFMTWQRWKQYIFMSKFTKYRSFICYFSYLLTNIHHWTCDTHQVSYDLMCMKLHEHIWSQKT
jgi:hypothetical protein